MSERFRDFGFERHLLKNETFDIEEGPIDIYLAHQPMRIVVPGRDLDTYYPESDCLIVDPLNYDPSHGKGFIALGNNEVKILGRAYEYDRFTFSPYVSAKHVALIRYGNKVGVTDLGSTNGTYYQKVGSRAAATEIITNDPLCEVSLAAYSVASESHPFRNEDAYFVDEARMIMGVFDGVGGAPGSERASQLAARASMEKLRGVHPHVARVLGRVAMYDALWAGHEAILNSTSDDISTTGIIAKVFETSVGLPYVSVASVGDSRAYIVRDDELVHVTLDQGHRVPGMDDEQAMAFQQKLANVTDISDLDLETRVAFMQRNRITSWLGRRDGTPVIRVNEAAIRSGDKVILTSDGVHDNLSSDEIHAAASQRGLAEDISRHLVGAAQRRSRERYHPRAKPDDMTVATLIV